MTAKKLTAFEQVRNELLDAMKENEKSDCVFTALGNPITDDRKKKLEEYMQEKLIASKRRTDAAKAAVEIATSVGEFCALLIIMVAAETKAAVQAETRMKMKLFEAITK